MDCTDHVVPQIKELSSPRPISAIKDGSKNSLCSFYICISQVTTFNKYQCVFFRLPLAINLL